MPIMKAPPVHPKNETVQFRASEDLKFRLRCYAEFIHASASFVVRAALERLFNKDAEFQEYLATWKPSQPGDHSEGTAHPRVPLVPETKLGRKIMSKSRCLLAFAILGSIALVPVASWADALHPDPANISDAVAGNLVKKCGFETGDFSH